MLGWGEPNFCNARILGKFGPLGNLSLGRTPAHPKLIILKRIAPSPYIYVKLQDQWNGTYFFS